MTRTEREHWMQLALQQARLAMEQDEVPVGALVVRAGTVIASAHNAVRACKDPSAHAEVLALRKAAEQLGSERLTDCTLICTLEPCVMCVGTMMQARIAELVFAAREPKSGACGSAFDLLSDPAHLHRISVVSDVLKPQSVALLQAFFARKR
jgi:tRNA(adenine34) deaminase